MRVLDLFCGAGGAAVGYYQAGFEVVGVDIRPQPNYPFEFIQADAMDLPTKMLDWMNGECPDLIHASPPCQGYSSYITTDGRWSHGIHNGYNEPKYIEPIREYIKEFNYVIENVIGAKEHLINPIKLCGAMFGLKIVRHRLFESNLPIKQPQHLSCKRLVHPAAEAWISIDPSRRDRRIYSVVGKGRQTGSVQVWKELMEMPWVEHDYDMAQAIPPAYTKYIGEQIKGMYECGLLQRL